MQGNLVVAPLRPALGLVDDAQAYKQVARLLLHGYRHVPQVGHAGGLSLMAAHLGSQMLAVDKGEHAHEIGMGHGIVRMERPERLLQPWADVAQIERLGCRVLQEHIGMERVGHRTESVARDIVVCGHDAVAEPQCLVQERSVAVHGHQSAG